VQQYMTQRHCWRSGATAGANACAANVEENPALPEQLVQQMLLLGVIPASLPLRTVQSFRADRSGCLIRMRELEARTRYSITPSVRFCTLIGDAAMPPSFRRSGRRERKLGQGSGAWLAGAQGRHWGTTKSAATF